MRGRAVTILGFAVEWSNPQKNKCHVWEKGRSSHHEVVSGNKDLETSAFIFLTLVIISVDGQHTVDFFPFVFTVIQEYLLKKKKKNWGSDSFSEEGLCCAS